MTASGLIYTMISGSISWSQEDTSSCKHPANHSKIYGEKIMESQSPNRPIKHKSPVTFFILVFLMSALFWLLGAVTKQALPEETSINLPISSLMGISPITVALIFTYRENGSAGVKNLLKRSFDYRRIKRKIWYLPVLLLMPAVMILTNAIQGGKYTADLDTQFPMLMVLVSSVLFLIEAICEEVGWQGYAFDPMQKRWNALAASLVLGTLWAVWHLVPFVQMHQSASWIFWQSASMVATRVLIVWIYNNTQKSVFTSILYHAMYNVSTMLLPIFGLIYDPALATVILIAISLVVIFLWGPKTLATYRNARSSTLAQNPSSSHRGITTLAGACLIEIINRRC
jgi:membrane protease YdiL (CAAX protease family)